MKLTHVCILTEDPDRLIGFYREVLRVEAKLYSPDYAEFPMEGAVLSIYRLSAHLKLAPGSAQGRSNLSVELEFSVGDVDAEYDRLRKTDIEWVKPPTTQPWGNRSFYFRDPDGNLVSFYSRANPPP